MARTARLAIRGMSCANCSGTVEDALGELDGVQEANVNFATDEGTVEYDVREVTLAEIYETIEDAGYDPVSEEISIGIGLGVLILGAVAGLVFSFVRSYRCLHRLDT